MHPWRARLERWFTPFARQTSLPPNAITIIALLLNVAGAAAMARGAAHPWLFLAAIPLIAVAGFADAIDGIVARVRDRVTPFGDFLDHCADRLSDALLATAWLVGSGVRQSLAIAAIISIMMNGYVGTQIEATYRQRSYDSVGRGEFVLALIVFPIVSYILYTNGWESVRFLSLSIAEWLAVLLIAFALIGIVQRFALARRLARS